jgi:hypothetical protein
MREGFSLSGARPIIVPATPHYSPRFRVISVSSVVKKNSYQGTADCTDETDTADEWKQNLR